MAIEVSTKDELKEAKEKGADEIIVRGDLANKLRKSKKVAKLGTGGLAILTAVLGAATVAAPVTGGLSFFAAAPVAALTGIEIAAIIAASSLGLALVLSVFLGYEEIEFSDGFLKLKKKSNG